MLRRNTCAAVTHGQADPGRVRSAPPPVRLHRDRQRASMRHGLDRIHDQIQQDLLDLRRITPDPRSKRIRFYLDPDGRSRQDMDSHRQSFVDQRFGFVPGSLRAVRLHIDQQIGQQPIHRLHRHRDMLGIAS